MFSRSEEVRIKVFTVMEMTGRVMAIMECDTIIYEKVSQEMTGYLNAAF